MRLSSNNVLVPANLLLAFLSAAILGASSWLASKNRQDCFAFLHTPVIIAATLLLCIAALGLFATCRRRSALLILYAVLLGLCSLLLASLAIFALAVAAPAPAGGALQYGKVREYRTANGFSPWLNGRVDDARIRKCLSEEGLCAAMDRRYKSLPALYFSGTVTETESGCCKPPTRCGFSFVNATVWEAETEAALLRRRYIYDCAIWSNEKGRLCYACEACRASILYKVRRHWLVVGGVSAAAMALLLALVVVAVLALVSLRSRSLPDEEERKKKQSPFI